MYDSFNQEAWVKCFLLVDPKLRDRARVDRQAYVESLRRFKGIYGYVEPWFIRLSLHLDGSFNKHDDRPFAYVYVFWQDRLHDFHLFRERWVLDSGRWFTRVAGLVANQKEQVSSA